MTSMAYSLSNVGEVRVFDVVHTLLERINMK
jgi:hypothetical protein